MIFYFAKAAQIIELSVFRDHKVCLRMKCLIINQKKGKGDHERERERERDMHKLKIGGSKRINYYNVVFINLRQKNITVYTRVQVDSSISRIEILKLIIDPKFLTLVYSFFMSRV